MNNTDQGIVPTQDAPVQDIPAQSVPVRSLYANNPPLPVDSVQLPQNPQINVEPQTEIKPEVRPFVDPFSPVQSTPVSNPAIITPSTFNSSPTRSFPPSFNPTSTETQVGSNPSSVIAPDFKNNVIVYHPDAVKAKSGGGFKQFLILILILLIIILGGATTYAYVKKIGPFSFSTYTESNFSSSILAKIASMNSASYVFSGALNVVPRDADAVPFDIKISNEKELKEAYYYDKKKLESAKSIISLLNRAANYNSENGFGFYNSDTKAKTKKYINSLDELVMPAYNDTETIKFFEYQSIENGNNFNLVVTFETNDALKSFGGLGISATSTKIDGKKVTFTKDSYISGYFSEEPPKPFLMSMGDSLSDLPSEMNAKIAISVSSDFKPGQLANWGVNLDAQGDFSDLNYKVNIDALKKDDNYYFKINNLPSFFLFDQLSSLKGKWVVIPSKEAPKDDYSPASSIQSGITGSEKTYKDNREKAVRFIKKFVSIADEEKIFVFKGDPVKEKVGERSLVKYILGIRKDKVLTFYTRMQDEINKDPEFADYRDVFADQGYINYLKSDEFSQTFDYVDKNNTLTLWVDKDGFPAIIQNVMRIVPPSSAVTLKDKQINVTFKLDISDINKPVDIKAPTDAVLLDKAMEDLNGRPSGEDTLNGQKAAMQSSLSNMRAQAELVYDQTSPNSYGKKPFTLGPCLNSTGTLFGDEKMFNLINSATKDNPSSATCVSSGSSGDVVSWAISAPIPGDDGFSWCVDSRGASKRIIESLKDKVCM